MRRDILFITVFFALAKTSYSQLRNTALSKQEIKEGVIRHYIERDDFAGSDLYLYQNHTFRYSFATCLMDGFSTGKWNQKGNLITLLSDYDSTNLPVKVQYRKKTTTDTLIKRIDFIKDNKGNYSSFAGLQINNDSTICFDADLLCFGEISKIDSIKVILQSGISSGWVKVQPDFEVLVVSLLPDLDFEKYIIFNEKYRIGKNGTLSNSLVNKGKK